LLENTLMKNLALASCFSLLVLGSLSAQETPRFGFDIGAGFTTPVGKTGRHLDSGWNLRAGAGYNFSPYVGAMIDVGYDSFGINSATLNNLGFPDGGLHIFSATLDPIIHLNPKGHLDVYVTGGGGLFRRSQEFTQPAVTVTSGFDPFFGFFPVAVPVNQVLSSYSVNKPGIDIGAGLAIGTKGHGKIFAEAKYNRIFMGNSFHTDYVPVTFGFRW
jgi:Outer membrane protein beta-barrel domain